VKFKTFFIVCIFLLTNCICLNATFINPETAEKIAKNWFSSLVIKRASLPEIKNIIKVEKTYVCNFEKGFVIVASDDSFNPIVGYSKNSKTHQIPPALKNFLKQYDISNINNLKRSNTPHPMWKELLENKKKSIDKAINYESYLIKTKWNQNHPWNEKCPVDLNGPNGHAYAGCVAVAMAQIMKYWGHPSQGTGAHYYESDFYGTLYANFETIYPWGNMPDTTANDAVKTLLYHCGVSVEMDYGPDTSSADTSKQAPKALINYFKYDASLFFAKRDDYSSQDWIELLRQEITEKRPILYQGRNPNNTGGHAFICDGYENNNFHFNWGWGGNYDGYFSLDAMTPDQDCNFNYDQGAIFGIKPVEVVNLSYPYEENFEDDNIPEPWIVKGSSAYVGYKEAYSGVKSLLLNDYTTTETGLSFAQLKINVPDEGATLRFYVKRGYSPQPSEYNQHKAEIRQEFGETVLHSFFDGDYNDSEWQDFFLDLTPWQSQTITLYFEQNNSSDSFRQWMAIDNIIIKQEPVANFYADNKLIYEGQTVVFNNTSTMSNSFLWQFGDGTISRQNNPEHQYNDPGIYTISLEVNNGQASITKQNYIRVLPKYTPPYSIEKGGNFEINPNDFSSGAISGSINLWEYGMPGNVLNSALSGTHVWKTGLSKSIEKGDYTCVLITPLFDLSASGTYAIQFYHQMEIYYNNCPGAAWIEYTTDEGQSWQTLGNYENNPDGSKNWYNKQTHESAPDNTPCWWKSLNTWTCSRLMIPELVGNKSVGFRFVYKVGSGWGNDQTYIIDGWSIDDFEIQYTPPTAIFDNPKLAYVGQPVQFTDQSVSAFSWEWSFGDQKNETTQHPVHTYSAPGYYSISLSINNGINTIKKENGIHILPDRGIPYTTEKGGNFETRVDDFDSQIIVGSTNLWEHGKTENSMLALQSSSNVWKTRLNENISKGQYQCALYTPNFRPTQSGTYSLNFDMSMEVTYANGPFAVQCQYSTDNGTSWTRLGEDNDSYGQNWYNRGPSSEYKIHQSIFNDQIGWTYIINNQPVSYKMIFDSSVQQIAFRFVISVSENFQDGYDNDGFMIDNFSLTGPTSDKPDLWISNKQLLLSAQSGSSQVSIENIGNNGMQWQVVNTISWINIQPLTGEDNAYITINYNENTGCQRYGCFKVSAENALNDGQFICLLQNAYESSPVISNINNIVMDKNSEGKKIFFSITDKDSPINQLNLWAESNNPILIPNNYEHLAIGGPVDQRNILIVPALDQTGTAIITLYAKDPDGLMGQAAFTVTVQNALPVNLDLNKDGMITIVDLIIGLRILSAYDVDHSFSNEIKTDLSIIIQIFKDLLFFD